MQETPADHLAALFRKYTVLSFIPDIDHYRRIAGKKEGRCIFRGCPEPIAWEDARGGNFLCEGHYRTAKAWIEEARRGLLPGGHPGPLFTGGHGAEE